MDFLRECADRLEAGAAAAEVMEKMRARYTTVRCLGVKTCLVRGMCRPTDAYAAAVAALGLDEAEAARVLAGERGALGRLPAEARRALPPRLADNVRALRLARAETKECKRLGAAATLHKNRRLRRVDGRALLAAARAAADRPAEAEPCVLALSLLLLCGRRTCELVSARSELLPEGDFAMRFTGQAKRGGGAAAYTVPVLHRAGAIAEAVRVLRARLAAAPPPEEEDADARRRQLTEHQANSRRFQSWFGRALGAHAVFGQAGRVHALRGVYACMCARLFEWDDDYSDAYIAMGVLGHAGLHESLSYTPFHLGDGFAAEPRLGAASLPASPPAEPPTT